MMIISATEHGLGLDGDTHGVYAFPMRSSEIIKILRKDGWFIHNIRGSHHQFKHSNKGGKVTVPHPKSDLPIGTVKNIFRQAGLNWRDYL